MRGVEVPVRAPTGAYRCVRGSGLAVRRLKESGISMSSCTSEMFRCTRKPALDLQKRLGRLDLNGL